MAQEIWNKLTQRDKLIGGGAVVVVIAWLIGVLLANVSWSFGIYKSSTNVFTGLAGGTGIGWLGLLAAIAAIVVIYLKYAPNMKITWPLPVWQILLGLAVVAAVVSLLILLFTFQNGDLGFTQFEKDAAKASGESLPSWPIMGWVAAIGMLAGSALMCWGAYQEYVANKA